LSSKSNVTTKKCASSALEGEVINTTSEILLSNGGLVEQATLSVLRIIGGTIHMKFAMYYFLCSLCLVLSGLEVDISM